jgi:hypothetical protein
MPFKRAGKKGGKQMYKSSSGRRYTKRQVRAYYATKGFKRAPRGK